MVHHGAELTIPTIHRSGHDKRVMNKGDIASQIFARIGCFDIAAWLHELARTLEIDSAELMPMPVPVLESHTVNVASKGIKLTLSHPHAGDVEDGDQARWALTDAQFSLIKGDEGHWQGALPCGLEQAPKPCWAMTPMDSNPGMSRRAIYGRPISWPMAARWASPGSADLQASTIYT
jgi:hypothetical protein